MNERLHGTACAQHRSHLAVRRAAKDTARQTRVWHGIRKSKRQTQLRWVVGAPAGIGGSSYAWRVLPTAFARALGPGPRNGDGRRLAGFWLLAPGPRLQARGLPQRPASIGRSPKRRQAQHARSGSWRAQGPCRLRGHARRG